MINEALNRILTQIAELNPILEHNYKVVDPNVEKEQIGINDALGDHMFIRIEPGENLVFSEFADSGCGGYRVAINAELFIVFEKCFVADKVFNILARQIASFNDLIIRSGSYDAAKIHKDLTNEDLPRQMTIVRFRLTINEDMGLELCDENICEETCC